MRLWSGLSTRCSDSQVFEDVGELGLMRALVAVRGPYERVGFAFGVPTAVRNEANTADNIVEVAKYFGPFGQRFLRKKEHYLHTLDWTRYRLTIIESCGGIRARTRRFAGKLVNAAVRNC